MPTTNSLAAIGSNSFNQNEYWVIANAIKHTVSPTVPRGFVATRKSGDTVIVGTHELTLGKAYDSSYHVPLPEGLMWSTEKLALDGKGGVNRRLTEAPTDRRVLFVVTSAYADEMVRYTQFIEGVDYDFGPGSGIARPWAPPGYNWENGGNPGYARLVSRTRRVARMNSVPSR